MKSTSSQGEALRWLKEHVGHSGCECLIWPFARDSDGRAALTVARKRQRGHRIMCELAHGPAPDDTSEAAHSCGKGYDGCVSPVHLRWADRSENEMDKVAHGTSNRGERHGQAKLTEAQVLQIRSLRGTTTAEALAGVYGVSRRAVSMIQSGQRWGWL